MNHQFNIDFTNEDYLSQIQNVLNEFQDSVLNFQTSDTDNNRFVVEFEFNIEYPNQNIQEDLPNYFKNEKEINQTLGKSIYINKKDEIINNLECPICLEKFEYKKYKRIVTCCNNTFHKKCLDKWLKKNSTCPACRNDFLDKKNIES